ncbi:hypothetical protein GJAV_G00037870 [Gymnothorax javanicus]|nr:hypothetical protein GJAV_G00037870 [Gymnothorax javanicus]
MTQAPANLRTSSWIASSLALISLISSLKTAVWLPNQGRYGLMRQVTITRQRVTEFQVPFTSHTQFMPLHLCFLNKKPVEDSCIVQANFHTCVISPTPQSLSYYTTIFVVLYPNLCWTIPQSLPYYNTIFVVLYHNLCRTIPQSLSDYTTIFAILQHNFCCSIPQSLSYYIKIFVILNHNLCHTIPQSLSYCFTNFVVLYPKLFLYYNNLCHAIPQSLSYYYYTTNFVAL